MDFLSSDLHFGHKRIVEFTARGEETTAELHTQWLIDLWNSQVNKSDRVWHFGDFSFYNKHEQITAVLRKLNGQKFMIKGNHDSSENWKQVVKAEGTGVAWFRDYHEEDFVIDGNKQRICMFHFPMCSWHKQHYGSWHLHGHCVDLETEILTVKGWLKRKELKEGDTVFTYNTEKNLIELDRVNQIVDINYSGQVYEYSGKSVNFRTTNEHIQVLNKNGKIVKVRNKDFRFQSTYHFITSSSFDTKVELSLPEIALYILIAADGSIKEETNLCRIRIKKEHKKLYIKKILDELGLNYKLLQHKDEYVCFNFYIPESIRKFKIKGLDEKLVYCSEEQFEKIVEAYKNSDGHSQKNGVIIYSAKEREINILQSCAFLNGYQSTSYRRNHGFKNSEQWQLSLTKNKTQSCRSRNLTISEVKDEHFWCVKTNNQTFVTRRNGRVHVTGNCHGQLRKEYIRGKMLDVGLDSARKILGVHRFFTLADIQQIMQSKALEISD